MADSEGVVQSMLQKLRLQEQRSEQASTTSEDLLNTTIEEVGDSSTPASVASDNRRASHTKWPGLSPFFKGSPKTLGLRKGPTGLKDNLSFSNMNGDIPKWERRQLRFSMVNSLIAEREKTFGNQTEPLNHETHTSPGGETEVGLGSQEIQIQTIVEAQETDGTNCDVISAQLTPDPVNQVNTVTDCPIWESITTEDTASSSTDSLRRNSEPADQVVTSIPSNNVRKNKRKWAETKRTKRFTQKIKDRWRDRHPSVEKKYTPNGEKFEEKEDKLNTEEQVSSDKSSEVKENAVLPPPIRGTEVTPCPQGYDSMSLSGFDMDFGTSLMDEICSAPEWTKFITSSSSILEVPESPGDQSTYPSEVEQDVIMQPQNKVSLPENMQEDTPTEAMVTGIDEIAPNDDDQPVDMENSGTSAIHLTTSEQVSKSQHEMAEVISDQGDITELNHNESQITTSLDPSHMDTVHDVQSEAESMSNTDDPEAEQTHMTEIDLNQTSIGDISPHQIEISTPDPDQASASDISSQQTDITTPDPDQASASDISPQLTDIPTPYPDQTVESDLNPHQTDITSPNPDQSNASYLDPHPTEIDSPNPDGAITSEIIEMNQIEMTSPVLTETNTGDLDPVPPLTTQTDDQFEESQITNPTLTQPDTSEMINPYLTDTTETDDQSETEEITPDQSSESSPGEGEVNAPQFLPLLDLSYGKTGDEGRDGSTLEQKRRALQSEERETFIDEDDDGNVPAKSQRKTPLSPPPFPPPLPPPHLLAERSISLDSESSLSETVPKKRRLDSTPRRVRFAEEVVMLPSYIQPEVEDWPEPEGVEEDTDEDPEDMEDMEEAAGTGEISTGAKEAMEKTPEAQLSIYNWILGITKKNKRKAHI